jgi:L-asparagine transporter-like permease
MKGSANSQRLNPFDVTNLVVGTTIGADIYVVAALGSAYLGPAILIVWLVAGAIATHLKHQVAGLIPITAKGSKELRALNCVSHTALTPHDGPFIGLIAAFSG